MKKPDRYEQMVREVEVAARLNAGHAHVHPMVAVDLLRRQHAAYVRMVKKMRCVFAREGGVCVNQGGCSACVGNAYREELLAAFARYKEGKP